jgi:predicted  nucleic acid-binding Zn-ribbon protein
LQTDLAKYEQIKTKNAQMLKNALETEKQLEQLRKEIVDMKKLKVKLMNQLKDETHKSKMEEQRRQREIAALKRDHLRKDNQIRSLEAEKRCREIVLKRKQEEIQVNTNIYILSNLLYKQLLKFFYFYISAYFKRRFSSSSSFLIKY